MNVDASDYLELRGKLKGADRKVAAAARKTLRDAAVPAGREGIAEGAAQMPHRGGLSALVAAGRVSVSLLSTGARLNLAHRRVNMASLERGRVRGTQPVPANAFGRPVEDRMPEIRNDLKRAMDKVAGELA